MTVTLATRANMRAYENAHPSRKVDTPDGPVTIMPAPAVALDVLTGETFAASPGDYFMRGEHEPLTSEDGVTPCILVVPFTGYRDALSGEAINEDVVADELSER